MSNVTLINPFEVPRGQEIAFLENWKRACEYFSRQEGFISTQLQRSVCRRTRFRFTNIAIWQSRQHFLAAVQSEEFRQILGELDLRHFAHLFDFLLERGATDRATFDVDRAGNYSDHSDSRAPSSIPGKSSARATVA